MVFRPVRVAVGVTVLFSLVALFNIFVLEPNMSCEYDLTDLDFEQFAEGATHPVNIDTWFDKEKNQWCMYE
ncbi:hypothetical protein [Shewanella subflava]|uniref:Uncharacterized protein n=1 Tax=Shewanella subflava TaxID=2986476 RepID=A0ABT3I5Y5_9GAMM|nr:hypothetical protein [Shewanella subflava]MCW3171384.1 hypothetical protein [Shewanella subflava]